MLRYELDIIGDDTPIWSGFVTKKFRRSDTPYPWILGVEVWSVGQKSRFFDLRWGSLGYCVVPKIFGAASYRVTWPGRKNLGVGGTFRGPVGAQKHFKLQNDVFWNDPQISFWPIWGRGASERPKNVRKKNLGPWRYCFIPWSFPYDKNW